MTIKPPRRPRPRSLCDLMERVVITDSGCWEWQGTRNRRGYGLVIMPTGVQNTTAHRLTWQIQNGQVFEGLFVCHHCDNPPCCNPAHLFLGTARDNKLDSVAKGRHFSRRSVLLTAEQLAAIRSDLLTGVRQKDVAVRYGISPSYASRIANRNRMAAK